MNSYAAIGSRKTPHDILDKMSKISNLLQENFILRSGGAKGADSAWECGITNSNKEIFLPWKNFNNHSSKFHDVADEALRIASNYHKRWNQLTQACKRLMGRNVYQILGYDLNSPVSFVLCWTQDGCESHLTRTSKTGGTGLAIEIASLRNIPVFNLKNYNSNYFNYLKFSELEYILDDDLLSENIQKCLLLEF